MEYFSDKEKGPKPRATETISPSAWGGIVAIVFETGRDERAFESPQALKARILKDAGAARRYARRFQAWTGRPPTGA